MEYMPRNAVDPVDWAGAPNAGQDHDGGWMVSFVDILMLLLTLFVLLLAFHIAQQGAAEPAAPAASSAARVNPPADKRQSEPAPGVALTLPQPTELLTEGQSMAALFAALREPAPLVAAEPPAPEPVASESVPPAEPASQAAAPARPALRLSPELHRRVEVAVSADAVNLNIKDEVLFDLASAELKADAQPVLNEIVAVLRGNDYAVSVEGHTDDTPIHSARFPSNWDLSVARATHVTRYLIEHGIAPERLRAIGYADTRPLQPGTTSKARARNRRVALVIHVSGEGQPAPPAQALAAPGAPVANGG